MLDRIGSGGMGVVWQAMDERLQRLVAVKQLLLQPDLSPRATDEARLRALREARIAARLQHPNAIIVYDVAEHDGEPCLVMEYLPSRSLAAVLAERCFLPVSEVASIGGQVASALAAAHAAQIVHRDVKPGNILITDEGTAKITDFGVSRAAGDVTVTQTGMMAGTPAYLAPEVARGQVPTPASDVFSLGATLYAAVEGQAPFGDNINQLALLHAVAAGEVPPPRHAGPLFAVLMSLLAKDPAARPDMRRASLQLATAIAARPVHRSVAGPPRPTRVTATPPPTLPSAPLPASPPAAGFPPADPPPADPRPADPPPADPRPADPPPAGRFRREHGGAGVLVGAILAVLTLVGVGTLLAGGSSGQQGTPPAGQAATSAPAAPPTGLPAVIPEPPQVQPVDHTQGSIAWRDAGQLVIDYYTGLDNLPAAWQMLSPTARAAFGSESNFRSHWSQYSSVSARNASGVSDNPDGSVTVPVDVSYDTGSGAEVIKRQLRVIQLDGRLLIDSDPR
ncbi:MAG: serine/threonine-protein kinase [Pseudonocardiales bacterium]